MRQAEKGKQKPSRHEVDVGKQGAIIALRKAGHKLEEIQSITNIPVSTVAGIIKHVQKLSPNEKENHDPSQLPLSNSALNPIHRSGRPRKFSDEDDQTAILYIFLVPSQQYQSQTARHEDAFVKSASTSQLKDTEMGGYGLMRYEEYHPDCVDLERPGDLRLMFWEAITYGIACKDSPVFNWEEETEEEREAAIEILAEQNSIAEATAKHL
ncbi:hypothetical protein HOY82DRAFT_613207 [Tuber indicum]|nr:hypothetical protein HOY82DRAFT_613207 [Tuber indicum]